jgi:phosphoribosylanthranilate isomerase
MTRIKVCGMTDPGHIEAAAKLKVDFLGMVFARSRRQISEEKALRLVETADKVKPRPAMVGVFVNLGSQQLNRIADRCRLDWVQLSGDETWDYCRQINRPIIKSIKMPLIQDAVKGTTAELKKIDLYSPDNALTIIYSEIEKGWSLFQKGRLMFLLDTKIEGRYGGTGQVFNWRLIEKMPSDIPFLIAGGLSPENVGSLIQSIHPWGVDVSSGVEVNGEKDVLRMEAFSRAVKLASN